MTRDSLKARLIDQARRHRKAPTAGDEASAPPPPRVAEKFLRFDRHPGYEQIETIRRGAKRFGLEEPFFKVHEGIAGATTVIAGQTYLNFASYNYLGLAGHPRVQEAAKAAIDRYGTSVSASRPVAGERPFHSALEDAIARIYGVPGAVAFVSGHATNVSTIGYLMGPRDLVLHDAYIHNSTIVGADLSGARRMTFEHNDPHALEALLARHRPDFERVLVVVEGLYSMDGDIPPLPAIIEAKRRHGAWLMVDEAHSFGTVGARGLGVSEHFGIDANEVDIWMGTLSKSLAGCGGFIAGPAPLVEMLRYLAPGFLYSVGMPPPVAGAAHQALEIMQEEPERAEALHTNSQRFLQGANECRLDTGTSTGIAVVPVIVGNSVRAARASHELLGLGINVQPILYPAVPEKSARLRFFLSSEHTPEQIDQAVAALQRVL